MKSYLMSMKNCTRFDYKTRHYQTIVVIPLRCIVWNTPKESDRCNQPESHITLCKNYSFSYKQNTGYPFPFNAYLLLYNSDFDKLVIKLYLHMT